MLDTLTALPQAQRNAAYDNTAAVANSARQLTGFDMQSAALAARRPDQLDLPYGAAQRQRFDFFPGQPGRPTLLFIHGGYWQMRHKNTFRFIAEGALKQGLSAALLGYSLAPEASLQEIIDQIRVGIGQVRAHARAQGANGDILLCGWSAGAHLTAMNLGCDGVIAGLGISGIYDLLPIRHTYLNQALALDEKDARALSPLYLPLVQKPFLIAYGTAELPQLQAQSLAFHAYRQASPSFLQAVEHADHFSILNALATSDGLLLQQLLAAAERNT